MPVMGVGCTCRIGQTYSSRARGDEEFYGAEELTISKSMLIAKGRKQFVQRKQ